MEKYATAWIDGGTKSNPGVGGSAFILDTGEKLIKENIKHPMKVTNNEAEYLALIKLLEYCIEHKIENILINTDSQLVANQINGLYQVRAENIKTLYEKAKNLISQLKNVKIRHISRKKNKEADRLVNQIFKGEKTNAHNHLFPGRNKGNF
jgi:ribonuclease HI